MTDKLLFTIDGSVVAARPGETIWQVAQREGIDIPHLCWLPEPGYRADGNCRACMVEIEGERVLAASCIRKAAPDLVVKTATDRAVKARRMVMELLLADQPPREDSPDRVSPFWHWAEVQGIDCSRFPAHGIPHPDLSHPAMAVNLDACIDCGLCVRACREVQVNDVIGMAFRNIGAKPVFDFDDPMGLSTCVACGECVQACPTGALMPKSIVDPITQHGSREVDREVHSVCPYCGVGCQISYEIKDNHIAFVQGHNGPANENRLCVKGRFGFDYVNNPQRLMKPLIRKPGLAKRLDVDPSNPSTHFREASWEEALDFAARGLAGVAEKHGNEAIAGFGSAKCSNEEAYLFQKLIRTRFRNNNIDHCTRLCHASSVAALIEGIGSGAVTATFNEVEHADVIMVIGANPTENHPVAATFFKQAAKRGATLIVIDPRGVALREHANYMLQFKPASDVALLNAIMHVIVEEGLYDVQYLQAYTEDFERLKQHVTSYSPESVADLCGIDAKTIRTVARTFGRAERAMIFWGMGISQHVHGTDNARCLIALALMCGQIGRPGTGLHPLRGQNNVQGASDAGLIPMFYPDYADVTNDLVHKKYEELWNTPLSTKTGLTVVEIVNAANAGEVRGMYIMGENPAMSDPDLDHARAGTRQARTFSRAGHLPHRDGDARRRRVAVLGMAGEVRHRNEHEPASADGPQGARSARRYARRSLDHRRAGQTARPQVELQTPIGSLRRDEARNALSRQHHLGALGAGILHHVSLPGTGSPGRGNRLWGRLPDQDRTRETRPGRCVAPCRSAGRGISIGADNRASA